MRLPPLRLLTCLVPAPAARARPGLLNASHDPARAPAAQGIVALDRHFGDGGVLDQIHPAGR